MKDYNIQKLERKLRKELDADRYQHTLGVMFTASALAMDYKEDIMSAQVAGLLHDCAKCIPNDKKIRMCREYGLEISKVELQSPYLLHSKLGAYLAKEKYGVEDEEILSAIRWLLNPPVSKPRILPISAGWHFMISTRLSIRFWRTRCITWTRERARLMR